MRTRASKRKTGACRYATLKAGPLQNGEYWKRRQAKHSMWEAAHLWHHLSSKRTHPQNPTQSAYCSSAQQEWRVKHVDTDFPLSDDDKEGNGVVGRKATKYFFFFRRLSWSVHVSVSRADQRGWKKQTKSATASIPSCKRDPTDILQPEEE